VPPPGVAQDFGRFTAETLDVRKNPQRLMVIVYIGAERRSEQEQSGYYRSHTGSDGEEEEEEWR